jgi:hypothetical protein
MDKKVEKPLLILLFLSPVLLFAGIMLFLLLAYYVVAVILQLTHPMG